MGEKSPKLFFIYIIFIFSNLADNFIQSDLQKRTFNYTKKVHGCVEVWFDTIIFS